MPKVKTLYVLCIEKLKDKKVEKTEVPATVFVDIQTKKIAKLQPDWKEIGWRIRALSNTSVN